MLNNNQKLAIYMEASLDSDYGKMGYGVMRYSPNPVACVVDSTQAGKRVNEACDLPYDIPVVATIDEARATGADVLVLGTAPSGGKVPEEWFPRLRHALELGMSLVNGLHDRLNDLIGDAITDPGKQWIWDVRQPAFTPPIATARAAGLDNKRLLMIGTDMAIGKMTAGLEIYRWLLQNEVRTAFVATGQIGITVTGHGIPLDAFKVDHACGAVESAVMDVADNDVIIVEGQGSLLHPGSTATLPLMRGSCANRLILCHRAGMTRLRKPEYVAIPPIGDFVRLNEAVASACGSLTAATCVGIALNTVKLDEAAARRAIDDLAAETGLPVDDVVRFGAGKLGQALLDS